MAKTTDGIPLAILREQAVRLLKGHPLFRYVSRRLLIDLVHSVGVQTVRGPALAVQEDQSDRIVAVVVVDGTLTAEGQVTLLPHMMALELDPQPSPGAGVTRLTMGVYLRDHAPLVAFSTLSLGAIAGDTASFVIITVRLLTNVRALLSALDLKVLHG